MRHPPDLILSFYGLGKLDDASAGAVNQHLESCPDCRRRVAELSSDSFLGRLRDAKARPDSLHPAISSTDGLSVLGGEAVRPPLPATSLPPGLADHPDYQIFHQAALGLQHAYEQGMVHRQVKPSHLMLSHQCNRALIKLLDFGLAKVKGKGTTDRALAHNGQMLGTPDYIAPEQFVDARRADIRGDIYSLGCTRHYLLTARPHFEGKSLYGILQAHHSRDALPLNVARPEVPIELAAVVGKMMAKEPDRRFQEPNQVAQALLPFFKRGSPGSVGSKPEVS